MSSVDSQKRVPDLIVYNTPFLALHPKLKSVLVEMFCYTFLVPLAMLILSLNINDVGLVAHRV